MNAPDPQRDPFELLATEFVDRCRRGDRPVVTEYAERYPELADRIRRLFPAIAAMERLRIEKEDSLSGSPSPEACRLERLGDFRIVREIGRGGMGVVYEAEQESLGRRVAVKVLPRSSLLGHKHVQRFEREAQTAAKLHHTNIVPVFGVGEQEGFHYIVMQLIDGVGLDAVLAQLAAGRPDRGSAAGLQTGEPAAFGDATARQAASIARALATTDARRAEGPPRTTGDFPSGDAVWPPAFPVPEPKDERGTFDASTVALPRDGSGPGADTGPDKATASPEPAGDVAQQPAPAGPTLHLGRGYWRNVARIGIQVAEALEYAHQQGTLHRDIKPANLLFDRRGVVWITDFGLAKAMEDDSVSRTGEVVGTLRYMAPERFQGTADARGDLYSLGLTLYELLALRPAFDDADRSRLIHRIVHEEAGPPRKWNPEIPRDLETIVLKTVAREPARRYASAGAVADDLRRFLDDLPIRARRTTPLERTWRWCRRNKALAAMGATAIALLVAVAVVSTISAVLTTQAKHEVQASLSRESVERKKAEATSALALEALDNIFAKFAPDRIADSSNEALLGDDDLAVPVQPVLSPEAAALLEEMLTFYGRLAAEMGDQAAIRLKVAEANRRIGDIHQRLGEFDQAQAAYRQAHNLYQQLQAESGDKGRFRYEIADILNSLGSLQSAMGQPEQGRVSHRQALALLQAAGPADVKTPQLRVELARTYYYLGKRAGRESGPGPADSPPPPDGRRPGGPARPAGNREGADDRPGSPPRPPAPDAGRLEREDNLRRAVEILQQLVAEYPSVADYGLMLARCCRDLPARRPGEPGKPGPDPLDQATEILRRLVAEYPAVPEYRYELCETLASVHFRGRRFSEDQYPAVEQRLCEALEVAAELVAEHPNIPDYAASEVQIHHKLAHVFRETNRPDLAEESLRKALALQSALVRQFPGALSYRVWQAVIQESLAKQLRPDELDEARSLLEQSAATLTGCLAEEQNSGNIRDLLARSYDSLAEVQARLGDEEAAGQARARAREYRGEM